MEPSGFVTDHFHWNDFRCHDGTAVPVELWPEVRRLCATLEKVRQWFGGPLVVVCGYRTPAYNEALRRHRGSVAKDSQHCHGRAADVRPVDHADLGRLNHVVETMLRQNAGNAIGGLGVYPSWAHIDIRDRVDGHVARWRADGVGEEP